MGMGVLLGIWRVGVDETTQEGGIDIGYIGGWEWYQVNTMIGTIFGKWDDEDNIG